MTDFGEELKLLDCRKHHSCFVDLCSLSILDLSSSVIGTLWYLPAIPRAGFFWPSVIESWSESRNAAVYSAVQLPR
jgi:hypothetical protein